MALASVESSKSRPKRNPARSAKKDPWSEEELLTSPKSRLIDIDLVVCAPSKAEQLISDVLHMPCGVRSLSEYLEVTCASQSLGSS